MLHRLLFRQIDSTSASAERSEHEKVRSFLDSLQASSPPCDLQAQLKQDVTKRMLFFFYGYKI